MNTLALTDVYNTTHNAMAKNDVNVSYVYNRSRPMIMYGFAKHIKDIFNKPIKSADIKRLDRVINNVGVWFDKDIFERIVSEFKGYLPLQIMAIPDGYYVPAGTPFCEIYNTVEGFGDLVTWWEARILKGFWGCCAATHAWKIKRYLELNNMPLNRIHNFAFRSYPSDELGVIADEAWGLFLPGSDGLHSSLTHNIRSIPAAAHKTIQSFDSEIEACKHIINTVKSKGINIVAVPTDTYDTKHFIEYVLPKVEEYAHKQHCVRVLYRLDSGDVMNFSKSLVSKGIPNIISDKVDFEFIKSYDKWMLSLGFTPEQLNLTVFGMGYGWFKDFNRDHLGWAMKVAYVNGKSCMKISNDEIKRSLPGPLNVVTDNHTITVKPLSVSEDLHELDYHNRNKSLYTMLYRCDAEHKIVVSDYECSNIIFKNNNTIQEKIHIDSELVKRINMFTPQLKG